MLLDLLDDKDGEIQSLKRLNELLSQKCAALQHLADSPSMALRTAATVAHAAARFKGGIRKPDPAVVADKTMVGPHIHEEWGQHEETEAMCVGRRPAALHRG